MIRGEEGSLLIGFISGIIGGASVATTVFLFSGLIPDSLILKNECEQDLPRNQVCEMVYIKPNLEVNNETSK